MKEIYCFKCQKYLGEIEKGKLRKGMDFICKECKENNNPQPEWFGKEIDFFSSIFNIKK